VSEALRIDTRDVDIQGWFRADNETAPLRVRLSIEDRSLCLHSLTGELLARWSPARLENRGIPFWARDWPIGDRDVPMQALTVENDEDYAAIQSVAPGLRSLRARTWRHVLLWPDAHGNLKAGPAFIWMLLLAVLALAGWRLLPF
jgi:hypothetical protein